MDNLTSLAASPLGRDRPAAGRLFYKNLFFYGRAHLFDVFFLYITKILKIFEKFGY